MVVQTQQKKIKTKEQKQLKLGIRHACRLTLTDCSFEKKNNTYVHGKEKFLLPKLFFGFHF